MITLDYVEYAFQLVFPLLHRVDDWVVSIPCYRAVHINSNIENTSADTSNA